MIKNQPYDLENNYISLESKDKLICFLKDKYRLDFSEYSEASVRRRISKILIELRMPDVDTYLAYLEKDRAALDEFIEKFTVNVTEMFRDPFFYKLLVQTVFETWKDKKDIKIWSAGCSTGEEVLSMAIMLREHGLLDKTQITGTDLSEGALRKARTRCYELRHFEGYTKAYEEAGGKNHLKDYFFQDSANQLTAINDFYEHIEFKQNNLISEEFANDFDMIVCRNVLIYFNANLQDKVIDRFEKSLKSGGYLVLGAKESVVFYHNKFKIREIKPESRIYQKI